MKKLAALLLVAIMCLQLVACAGKTKMTKEEMVEVAVSSVRATDIINDSRDNLARAKQKYCNQTILLTGMVISIQDDCIEMAAEYSDTYVIDVYLSIDELAMLEKGQSITVVGTMTDEILDVSKNIAGHTFDFKHYQMLYAYLVKAY